MFTAFMLRGNVKLRPDILKNSQALVQSAKGLGANPLDLVFMVDQDLIKTKSMKVWTMVFSK